MSGEVLRFFVEGAPVAFTRVLRSSAHEERAQKYFAYKEEVGFRAKEAGAARWDGPVELTVVAWVGTRRWDADNLLKGVSDALNKVAYVDDKQIVRASVSIRKPNKGREGVFVSVHRVAP